MFGFLKKKLKEGIEKISKAVSEKEEEKIEEVVEEVKKEEHLEESKEKLVKEVEKEIEKPEKKKPEVAEEKPFEGVKITYFIHGSTVDNEKELASGWVDVGLSDSGKKQSIELKDLIKEKKFDFVFCSDLARAVDSAKLTFGDSIKIIQDKRLREVNYGDLTRTDSKKVYSQMLEHINKPFPNGESYRDVERRIAEFLNYLLENYYGKSVAIVAHRAPQLALDVLLKGKAWEQAIKEDWRLTKKWQPGWEYEIRQKIEIPEVKAPEAKIEEKAEEKTEKAKKIIETAKEIEKVSEAKIGEKPKKGFFERILKRKPKEEEPKPEKKLKEEPKKELPEEEKGIIEKIKKKITEKKIEEDDVKDILKDMEMSLISSDVAVEVSDKIISDLRKNLVGNFIKRGEIEKVIKNSFRDSILDILKVESFDLIEKVKTKKPFLIVFLGFNGVGKCVLGDTLIPFTNGSIVKIKDVYFKASKDFSERSVEDGFAIDIPRNYLNVYSINLDTLKIEQISATRLWKLKKNSLVKIRVENGHEVTVTPEHPFFVLKNGNIEKVCAENLTKNAYVMLPRKLESKLFRPSFKDILFELNDKKVFIHSRNIKKIYDFLINNYGNMACAWRAIGTQVSYDTFSYLWKRNNVMSSAALLNILKNHPQTEDILDDSKIEISFTKSRAVELPLNFNEDLGRFVGYICGEGHLGKNYIEFTNSDNKLLLDFHNLSNKIFSCEGKIKVEKRNPNVKYYIISSAAITMLLNKIFGIKRGNKSSSLELSEFALKLPEDFWKGFLSTYTDSDGSISTDHRAVELSTASYNFAKQLSIIFLRFGINTSISTKIVEGKPYYRIYVLGKSKIEKFSDLVKLVSEDKNKRLESILEMPAQFEISELIPNQGELIRNFRICNGFSQVGVANSLGVSNTLICQNEIYDVPIPRSRLKDLLTLSGNKEEFLSKLADSDVIWLRIENIDKIFNNDEYVYDLTVPKWHNFVADNFIVHNTTSIARIGYLLKKNGISCVFAAADSWRAAAIEQLEEHGKNLDIYVIKHKYGADPAAVIFDAVKHAESKDIDVVLADTAGRSHANVNLMDELKKIIKVNKPDLKILVLDALTGNDIYDQCKMFNDAVGVDGLIITKADVYEKGGATLSASHTIKKPILYLGVGQNYEDLEKFDSNDIVKRLLE